MSDSTSFNAAAINSLADEIRNANECGELQFLVNQAMASVKAQEAAILAQIAALEPMLVLLSIPTDLGSVITWATNIISHLITPIVKPYYTYLEQVAALAAAVSNLVSAIESAESNIVNCTISIPSFP